MSLICPCCKSAKGKLLTSIGIYNYYNCSFCQCIFIDPVIINEIDNGLVLVKYDQDYWDKEIESSRERSYGPALARMAEAFYYSRIKISKFVDIGTGPGYFLDAIDKYLPNNKDVFWGIEKFPPPVECRTKSDNYIIGDISEFPGKIDGGICIEVIEHVTPNMLNDMFDSLSKNSNDGALYIFNTGMPEYVIKEDKGYLDPIGRGHILSYSLKSIEIISSRHQFRVHKIPGKTWAFAIEYKSKYNGTENITNRIWSPVEHNIKILDDKDMGCVLKILGLETSRAYL